MRFALIVAASLALAPLPATAQAARPGILLLAHGGNETWNTNVEAIARTVDATHPTEVAFGMATRANIQAAVSKLEARGATEIVAVPLFISSHSSIIRSTEYLLGLRKDAPPELARYARMSHGPAGHGTPAAHSANHATHDTRESAHDTAADPTTPITTHLPIRMTKALDDHAILGAIVADRARSISTAPAREAVILAVHGPVPDADNALWLRDLRTIAAHVTGYASVDALSLRDDAPAPVRDAATAELRATVTKRRAEGRDVLVVPVLLSYGGIEEKLKSRLAGLDYRLPPQGIAPDARLADWVKAMAAAERTAQAGRLEGVTVDEMGAPLPGVTVQIDNTTLSTVSDQQGRFVLANVPSRAVTVRALLSGFVPVSHEVNAGASAPIMRLVLTPGGHVFEQVVVREDGYAARSVTSTRTATPLRDLPQSIQVVTRDLAEDQGATYLNDTLRNVSGVNAFSDYLDFNMRGFRTQSDGAVKRDGLDQVHDFFFRPRLMNVERVEVVKGPAGALYGHSRPGGFINVVTRQPSAQRETEVAGVVGSWDKSEAHVTSTGPVPGTERMFYLGSVSRIDNRGFRAHEQLVYTGVAGTLTWAPSADTAVTAGAEWLDDLARGHRNRGIPFFQHRLVDVPVSFSVNEPDDAIAITGATFRARIDHRIGQRLRFDLGAVRLTNENTQQYHEPRGLAGDGRTMRREFRDQYRERTQTAVNTNAEATLSAAGMQHRLLAGAEYSRLDGLLRSGIARDSSRGGPVPDLDIYAPVYASPLRPLRFGYYGAQVPGGISALATSTDNRVETRGIYLQDQMTIGARVSALAGVRYDDFSSRTLSGAARTAAGSALSMRAGAVAHVSRAWSAYGNFAQGFEPPSASLNLDPERYGGPFDPERSWSVEGGIRGAFGRRASLTASLYHITKHDVTLFSPTADLPDRYVQIGAFESRGFELDAAGQITEGLSLHANYAHSFLAEITEDVNPANIGKPAENNPAHAAGLWVRYNTDLGWRGTAAGAAAGLTYVGDRLTFEAGDILPAYTVVDAAVYLSAGPVRTALNLFNVTNREHFTGGYGGRIGGFRGVPRSAELRVSVRF